MKFIRSNYTLVRETKFRTRHRAIMVQTIMAKNVRGLSDIVKRRSFRANAGDIASQALAQLSKHSATRAVKSSNRDNVDVGGA